MHVSIQWMEIYLICVAALQLVQLVKYGVISVEDLSDDLMQWRWLYISGRLHKPVSTKYSLQFWDAPSGLQLERVASISLVYVHQHIDLQVHNQGSIFKTQDCGLKFHPQFHNQLKKALVFVYIRARLLWFAVCIYHIKPTTVFRKYSTLLYLIKDPIDRAMFTKWSVPFLPGVDVNRYWFEQSHWRWSEIQLEICSSMWSIAPREWHFHLGRTLYHHHKSLVPWWTFSEPH